MNWFVEKRQNWIMESVHIFGFINREHIIKKFGVSVPQASQDLRLFIQNNPKILIYNKNAKRYELNENYKKQAETFIGWQ